jgi:flap endonuclease-1
MYIDFALLLGTDFSQRIKNVGPSRALKFIRAHGSIEKVIEEESKFSPRVPKEDYMMEVIAGRAVFGTLPPITKEIVDEMRFRGADEGDAKTRFVMEKYGLSRILEWNWEEGLEGNYFGDGLNSGPSGGYFGDNPSSGDNW